MAIVKSKSHQAESLEETLSIAANFGAGLPSGAVVLFDGDLGSGKTTFIKGIAQGACDLDPAFIVSPTFSLLNIYQGTKALFHFDLYRLKGSDDFIALGFDDYLTPDGITCIEWSERISDLLPQSYYRISIKTKSGDQRLITISKEE